MHKVPDVGVLHEELMSLLFRLAAAGLIHSDFNEFNLLLREDDAKPILIDFPQMVSTSHANAAMYFERDVRCINDFFRKRFGFEAEETPGLDDVETSGLALDTQAEELLVAASGWRNELGEEYASGDEDALRNYSSFSDTEDEEEEAPLALPIQVTAVHSKARCCIAAVLKKPDPVAAWVAETTASSAETAGKASTASASPSPAHQVPDQADDQSSGDVRSVVTTSTIAPAEIRSRLRKQVSHREREAELKAALRKTGKVSARRARVDNRKIVEEYAGWLD